MRRLVVALLCGVLASTAAAETAGYERTPRAELLLDHLRDENGFSPAELAQVRSTLAQAQRLPKLIQTEQTAKEKTLRWDEYAPIHINAANIANGRRYIAAHRAWFDRAEAQYGVPAQLVAAILGVETKYGTFTGRYRALDSLATMGFEHPTRADFFLSELQQLFVLCRDDRFRAETLLGSYAGALGAAQFMPSNYLRIAVDFDSDGRVDLWSAPDAIGSIAHYFVSYRPALAWQRGEPVYVEAQATRRLPSSLSRNGRAPDTTVGALMAAGLQPKAPLPPGLPAGLIQLETAGGPVYWIALNNFYSVMTYNPRIHYAAAVAALAEAMVPPPRGEPGS